MTSLIPALIITGTACVVLGCIAALGLEPRRAAAAPILGGAFLLAAAGVIHVLAGVFTSA